MRLVLSFVFVALISVDGFFRLLDRAYVAGSNNFLSATTYFLLVTFLYLKANKFSIDRYEAFFVFFAAFCVVVASVLPGGEILKGGRDVIYLFSIFFTMYFFRSRSDSFVFHLSKSILVFCVLLSALGGWLLSSYEDGSGRFMGFQASPTIFSNVVMLACITFGVYSKGRYDVLLIPLAMFLISLAGTRANAIGLLLYFLYSVRHRIRAKYLLLLLLSILLVLYVFRDAITRTVMDIVVQENSRLLSVNDFEQGSLATRLEWYLLLIDNLKQTYYFGWLGAGASEKHIGFITHFDMLRFWYDYGLLFMVVLTLIFYRHLFHSDASVRSRSKAFAIILVCSILVLIGFHNAFQAPPLIILFCLFLDSVRRDREVEIRRPNSLRISL